MLPGERVNTYTHLFGVLLAFAGSIVLIAHALASGDGRKTAGLLVFCAAMVLLYAASALYHGSSGRRRQVWSRLDHCAIYVLIAGTYTPLALLALHGIQADALLAAIWGLALLGIVKEFRRQHCEPPMVALYVVMGWLGLTVVVPLVRMMSRAGLLWLLLGAILYTVGVLFYLRGARTPHAHGVWHLFVLGGTASHYMTMLQFVA